MNHDLHLYRMLYKQKAANFPEVRFNSNLVFQVRIKGLNITEEDYRRIFKYVGYCPQDDVLWKNITVREHIELYATIRGIPRDRMDE